MLHLHSHLLAEAAGGRHGSDLEGDGRDVSDRGHVGDEIATEGSAVALPSPKGRRLSRRQTAAFSRMWTPQAEPRPITWARPTLALSIWRSPASPRRWWQTSQMLAMPVAAIGWPFDSRPPDTLTGVVPSRQEAPDSKKSTAPPSLHSIRLS